MNLVHKYLPEMVYGSIDGTVTTFAIISGVAGAGLSPMIVIILGISNVLADGFSMASSSYLAKKSESDRDQDDHSTEEALRAALATFVSFVLVGSIPLLAYLFSFLFGIGQGLEYQFSIVLTTLAFIYVGAMRGKVTKTSIPRAILETLIIGTIAALVAYFVGKGLSGFAA